jgi:transposase
MAAEFVVPDRQGDRNDANAAAAICEAVCRPQMRWVPVKSVEQQAVLGVHSLRQGLVEERTALANRLRGLLAEYGVEPQSVKRRIFHAIQWRAALTHQPIEFLQPTQ